jgi:hypothetical protein
LKKFKLIILRLNLDIENIYVKNEFFFNKYIYKKINKKNISIIHYNYMKNINEESLLPNKNIIKNKN